MIPFLATLSINFSQAAAAFGWLALLVFYVWLAKRGTSKAVLTTQPFGIPDALCSGTLAVWMILLISHGFEAPQTITMEAIVANSILYGALVLGIFGVIGFQRR